MLQSQVVETGAFRSAQTSSFKVFRGGNITPIFMYKKIFTIWDASTLNHGILFTPPSYRPRLLEYPESFLGISYARLVLVTCMETMRKLAQLCIQSCCWLVTLFLYISFERTCFLCMNLRGTRVGSDSCFGYCKG